MTTALIGLDIGSSTIKAVQLVREKKNISLLSAGYIATPSIDVSVLSQHEERELAKSINRLIHDMKVTTVQTSLSLPSAKVVTRVIDIPIMSESELASSIKWEVEPYIPLPMDKVKMDYAVISENQETKKMKLLIVAAPTLLVEKYTRVAQLAGLTAVSLETKTLAVARSISQTFVGIPNILLVNIGSSATDIGLLHEGVLLYTKSFPMGGNALTRAIAEDLGFEPAQAEEYKKTYGLEEDKLEGKIAKILLPLFSNIFTEMEKTVAYFKGQYPEEDITLGVMCGGTAKMPGFVLSVTRRLGLDCQLANPFSSVKVDQSVAAIINPDASQYTAAVGLALRDVEST